MFKFFEWLGLIVCMVSILANGIIRHNGLSGTLWSNVTFYTIFIGMIITVGAFFGRKFKNKESG